MMPIEALTAQDLANIENYITNVGHPYPNGDERPRCSVEHYLRFWNDAKSEYLFDLFGEQLILSKPITYERSEDEIIKNMMDDYDNDTMPDEAREFFDNFFNLGSNCSWDYNKYYWTRKVCSWDALAENKIEFSGSGYTFEFPNGKKYRLENGVKPMKAIRKIAEGYGIEKGFQAFCNWHSQCLNQKKLSGDICFSIHPMDYMTMSDNDSEWETCMSWANEGCYRQGTVEMMNSPCVVVGYLKSNRDYHYPGGTWNDKRWRCLFVVDKNDFIISIKEYPYENKFLIQECIKQLCDLTGWKPETYKIRPGYKENPFGDEREVYISFYAGAMYNDFTRTDHYIAFSPIAKEMGLFLPDYYYSGTSMCIWCGDTCGIGDEGNEMALICDSCNHRPRCACCGHYINEDDGCWVGDDLVCEDCSDETVYDDINRERIWREDSADIYLYPDDIKNPAPRWNLRCVTVKDDCWDLWPLRWNDVFKVPSPHYDEENHCYYVTINEVSEDYLTNWEFFRFDYKKEVVEYASLFTDKSSN